MHRPLLVLLVALAIPSAATTGSATTAGAGARDQQAAALARILKSFPALRVSGRVGRPPADERRPRASWVYFTYRRAPSIELVRGRWQALVASGVLRAFSRPRGWPPVLGYRLTYVDPRGRRHFESESVLGRSFTGSIAWVSEFTAERMLRESSARVGVTFVSVRFARPLARLAAEVVVETDDPHAFVQDVHERIWNIALPLNRGSGRPRAEGVYVLVRARNGTWVAASGHAVRASGGASVVNPQFQ